MNRLFCNILADSVSPVAEFYERTFGMRRHFDSDWFVLLVHDDLPGHEYGILQRDADIVPEHARTAFGGCLITFVVADCREAFARAEQYGAEVVEPPRLMPYGQLRALVRDPAGTLIDISSPADDEAGG
ncbi:MAG: VOC family protein [Pseudomonadota bacterium]